MSTPSSHELTERHFTALRHLATMRTLRHLIEDCQRELAKALAQYKSATNSFTGADHLLLQRAMVDTMAEKSSYDESIRQLAERTSTPSCAQVNPDQAAAGTQLQLPLDLP